MAAGVAERAFHSLLFAVPQTESNRAGRSYPEPLHLARNIDQHRDVFSVVERAIAQVPRIEMRANQYDLVCFGCSRNFPDDVVALIGAPDIEIQFRIQRESRSIAQQSQSSHAALTRYM